MNTGSDTDFMNELDAVRHMELHRASGILLGSVTNRVIHLTDLPVLVVK